MHPNAAFRGDPGALLDRLLEGSAFATLFAHSPDGPRAAHVPVLRSETGRLLFHLARPNALTRHLDGAQAMLVLQGPDAYVSARWHDTADQVPTWNYVALECDGTVARLGDGPTEQLVSDLSDRHEARISTGGVPWTMAKMSDPARRALLRGIVGFEFSITAMRDTLKLSQNKPAPVARALADHIEAEGNPDMACWMRDRAA